MTRRPAAGAAAVGLLLLPLAACARDARPPAGDSTPAASGGAAASADSIGRADSAAARGDSARWVVTATGIGPVRFGMTVDAAGAALGETVRPKYADFESCDYVRPEAMPAGVMLMVVSDTVERVDVDSVGVATAEGARVGDSEARVLALYAGRVRVEPHHYTGPVGHYLVVSLPGDTLHRIIFETDGKRVTEYRAGRRPAVEYVEGCA